MCDGVKRDENDAAICPRILSETGYKVGCAKAVCAECGGKGEGRLYKQGLRIALAQRLRAWRRDAPSKISVEAATVKLATDCGIESKEIEAILLRKIEDGMPVATATALKDAALAAVAPIERTK